MLKKFLVLGVSMALVGGIMAGCSSNSQSSSSSDNGSQQSSEQKAEQPKGDVEMKYISADDAKANLDNSEYTFVDVRKAADFEAGHVPGAVSADMDAAKGGDMQSGIDNMKAALKDATGDEMGGDQKIVLICYSGKSYAQAGTNVLSEIGANMDNVFTLEGGMKAYGDEGLEK